MMRFWPLAGMLCLCAVAAADVVTIAPARDNTIYNDFPGNSNGSGSYFFTGTTIGSGIRRGLICFDVAGALPAGATVNSATLTLWMSKTINSDQPVSLHRLTADWGEASSDAPGEEGGGTAAAPGDATWIHSFHPNTKWFTQGGGGDFVATSSATTAVGGIGTYSWATAAMAADVQGWLDAPATNFGWIVVGNEADLATAKRFDSRENALSPHSPTLTIDYTPAVSCDPCDTNCDGSVNGFDIGPFVQALNGNPDGCSPCNSDTNGDGSINGFDIGGFVDCLNAP